MTPSDHPSGGKRASSPDLSEQARLNAQVDQHLKNVIAVGPRAVLTWILGYAQAFQVPCIDLRVGDVLSQLLAAGYSAEDAVRQGVENRDSYGRKVIGLFIDTLARGEGPPANPVIRQWLRTLEGLPHP